MSRPSFVLPLLLASALLTACIPPAVPRSLAPGSVTATLVDSLTWEDESGTGGVLRRVEIRSGYHVDTLPQVLTSVPPVVVGSKVLGFAYSDGAITHAFQFDARSGKYRKLRLPSDLSSYLSTPALSPDGRYIAYVALPGDATAYGVVRTWPKQKLVVRSSLVEVPATDFAFHYAEWSSPEDFMLYVDLGDLEGLWHRIRGSVHSPVLTADSVHGGQE